MVGASELKFNAKAGRTPATSLTVNLQQSALPWLHLKSSVAFVVAASHEIKKIMHYVRSANPHISSDIPPRPFNRPLFLCLISPIIRLRQPLQLPQILNEYSDILFCHQ